MDVALVSQLALALSTIALGAWRLRQSWRADPENTSLALWSVGFYVVYGLIGVFIGAALAPTPTEDPVAIAGVVGFILAWFAYGMLWLLRVAMRHRPLPACIGRQAGWPDAVVLAIAGACLFAFLT